MSKCHHTILIVDDIESNLFALEKNLKPLGAEVLRAQSGNEALTLVLNHKISLVLLDVQMPDMSGFEVAELMRGHEETLQIPIVFITAISREKEHIFKGYELGAVDYIVKPVDPLILRRKVETFLKIEEHRRQIQEDMKRDMSPSQTHTNILERMRTWEREQREEVRIARQVQKTLLPCEPLANRGWEIETFLEPAMDVGGDYVDIIPLGDSRIGLVLADVSGHGIPAALITGMIHAWCHSSWNHDTPLSELCSKINSYLHKFTLPEMYCSIFLGILDTKKYVLEYILAGHPEPIFYQKDKVFYTEETRQPVLGMMPAIPQYIHQIHFNEGDRLLVYSDGLSDHLLPNIIGTGNLKEHSQDLLLSTLKSSLDDKEECGLAELFKTISSMGFVGQPTDDVTMMMITLKKSGETWRSDATSANKKRVLVIDDHKITRMLISKILSNKGFDCSLAEDSKSGLKLFHQGSYDLVITDIVLPGQSGYEVLQAIKLASPFTPVMLITAEHSRQVLEKGVMLGADSYLRKPLSSSELIQATLRLLFMNPKTAKVAMGSDREGRFQFWLSSSEESLLTMRSFIDALLKNDLPVERIEELQYCVQEIGKNALEWGNSLDEHLRVSVIFDVNTEKVVVEVKDRGRGFNVRKLLESLEDFESYQENREVEGLRPGGFGLKIVSELVDDLIFSEDGTEMKMVFLRPKVKADHD